MKISFMLTVNTEVVMTSVGGGDTELTGMKSVAFSASFVSR